MLDVGWVLLNVWIVEGYSTSILILMLGINSSDFEFRKSLELVYKLLLLG